MHFGYVLPTKVKSLQYMCMHQQQTVEISGRHISMYVHHLVLFAIHMRNILLL
jgi:hypothetical protein